MQNHYLTSKDYEELVRLLNDGMKIICFVDYDSEHGIVDVAKASMQGDWLDVGVRGICYFSANTQDEFVRDCCKHNLEWIVPNGDQQSKKYDYRKGLAHKVENLDGWDI